MYKDDFYGLTDAPPFLVYYLDSEDRVRVRGLNDLGQSLGDIVGPVDLPQVGRWFPPTPGIGIGSRVSTDGDNIYLFDTFAGSVRSYPVTSGKSASSPYVENGKVYWAEFQVNVSATPFKVTLIESDIEFNSVVEKGAVNLSPAGVGEFFPSGRAEIGAEYFTDRMLFYVQYSDDATGTKKYYIHVQLNYSGAGNQQSAPYLDNLITFPNTGFRSLMYRSGGIIGCLGQLRYDSGEELVPFDEWTTGIAVHTEGNTPTRPVNDPHDDFQLARIIDLCIDREDERAYLLEDFLGTLRIMKIVDQNPHPIDDVIFGITPPSPRAVGLYKLGL